MQYADLQQALRSAPRTWLVTGVAGFIGSNLLETLLRLDQTVTGLDNFSRGSRAHLEEVRLAVTPDQWSRFHFLEGDIAEPLACREACAGTQIVLHQAALRSVPGSFDDPVGYHRSNVTGFINMLVAAREAGAARFVFASSSAVYGDDPQLPKIEHRTGNPLSPYAATKVVDEIYAGIYGRAFGLPSIGLRYFNVFGPRQDPGGAYAAVIPEWVSALRQGKPVYINGDGETSRDFCYVSNIVQANMLAATTSNTAALNQVYNIALGERVTLNDLFRLIQQALRQVHPDLPEQSPVYREFRSGDVRHSLADIGKARRLLGYEPAYRIGPGLGLAMDWYLKNAVFQPKNG